MAGASHSVVVGWCTRHQNGGNPTTGGWHLSARCEPAQPLYINDPGVVSSSPVSSQVFRPERIIGQPP